MAVSFILWRRLDAPGHDACRLQASAAGWKLEGAAVFRENTGLAVLSYSLTCDMEWRTQRGEVQGWIDEQSVKLSIARTNEGIWKLNNEVVPGLEDCIDLDFGFTPATNLPLLRRLQLTEGQQANVSVAWLDVSRGTLTVLPQRYVRRTGTTYEYESPALNYRDLLEVDSSGFVRRYPGLWQAESD